LSTYNIEQIHKYYYENQKNIIAEAEAVNLYVDLNEPLPENLSDVVVRKVNLNIRRAIKRHNTIEHRIYKSTLNIDEVKWCVNHTLNTIEKAIV
jgi:predicted GTPase